MTEKLYYLDSYMSRFEATVLSCEGRDGGYAVVLDRTAFFPEEGGQYSDRGTLGGAAVTDVREVSGVIYHICSSPLECGVRVSGVIDFDERFEKMQCHTAEHILCGLFHKYYGVDNVGFHLGAEDVTLDISAPLEWCELIRVEELANRVITENVSVTAHYPTAEELPALKYRAKLELTEGVRIINIGEYDSCACCAPHVAFTGEIGSVKILDAQKMRGGMRIHITAGERAYRIYRKMYDNLSAISRALSVPRLESAEGVARLLSELDAERERYKSARLALLLHEARDIPATDGSVVRLFPDATQEELREVANAAGGRVGGILVLLSGGEGCYKYVISSASVDLRAECKKINAALGGRGGGSSVMIQGGFGATLSEIEKYFI